MRILSKRPFIATASLMCGLVAFSLAHAQSTAPAGEPIPAGLATQPASDLQNAPLDDTQKDRYITAVTTARRDRPAASVSLRRELTLALENVDRRIQTETEQSRKRIATAQAGRDTANASRRGGKGWYGGQMEQMYSQKLQQEQQSNQATLARLNQERAVLTAQLARLDALDRLYADTKEAGIHAEYGQAAAADMAGRRADAEYRRTAVTGTTRGSYGGQLFTLATTIRKEYEKVRGPVTAASRPSDASTQPG